MLGTAHALHSDIKFLKEIDPTILFNISILIEDFLTQLIYTKVLLDRKNPDSLTEEIVKESRYL